MPIIKLEGQEIPIDAALAASDDLIRKALLPFYPEVGNATIGRKEENGDTIITIVKRAGSIGCTPFEQLVKAPESINPAIALAWRIKRKESKGELKSVKALLKYHAHIDQAIEQGECDAQAVNDSMKRLEQSPAQSSKHLVLGF